MNTLYVSEIQQFFATINSLWCVANSPCLIHSNDFLTQKHQMMTNSSSWQNSESKHMHIGFIPTTWPDLTLFWRFLPSLTPIGLIWPQIILISNLWQNFESKHMHIGYIPTTWPDLTLIWRLWPQFDPSLTSWWPDLTSKNFEFEFWTKFGLESYVYWVHFDLSARFDPNLTALTQVWPLDDLIWPQKILNLNSGQNSESKHMYIGYISTNLPDLTLIWRF